MKAVFLDRETVSAHIDLRPIEQVVSHLTCHPLTQPREVVKRCLGYQVVLTNKVLLTADILAQLPDLKLICITATGMNNVDLEAARRLGIEVKNVSGYSSHSVSQYVFAMLLNHCNKPQAYANDTQGLTWSKSPIFCMVKQEIIELAGLTFGIVGYGDIGREVATIARALGMQVIIAERPDAKTIRDGRLPFEQVLATADILSLHCPLTNDTAQLINQQTLSTMKPGAILINTARGPLIDNHALLAALNSGQLSAAILDVLDQEPPPEDHPLLVAQPDNLYLTAHVAWASTSAQQQLILGVAENIRDFCR